MARLSYVEMDKASPEVREVYEKVLKGKPVSFHKILAHLPAVPEKPLLPFYASVGRSLDRRLYEMVVHPRLDDQRLPLLHAASSGRVQARRPQAARIGST